MWHKQALGCFLCSTVKPSTTCHWDTNRGSEPKYDPIFVEDHFLIATLVKFRDHNSFDHSFAVCPLFPRDTEVLLLAETLHHQCMLNGLANSYCP